MAKKSIIDFGLAKEFHKNPRTISEKQYKLLGDSLDELGDLSGIVHNLNTNEIISGNQRTKFFKANEFELEITERYPKPSRTGTLAIGFIIHKGEKYSYRAVKWTPEQSEKANIIANKVGGKFDYDILANQFEMHNLLSWGFDQKEFGIQVDIEPIDISQNETPGDPSADQSPKPEKAEGMSMFQLMLKKENREKVDDILSKVKTTYGFSDIETAFMEVFNKFRFKVKI